MSGLSYNSDPNNQLPPNPYVPLTAESTTNNREESEERTNVHGLPGVQHELRFEIAGGTQQCLFQFLRYTSQLHVTFQVVRGADNNINLEMRRPSGDVIEDMKYANEGNIDKVIAEEGVYSFCFDNSMSRFSSKLIYFYLLSYIEEDWRRYATDMQDFNVEVDNFTKMLETVNTHTNKVLVFQAVSRRQVIADWYTVVGNNSYVRNLSIIMCVVIVMTSAFQVYFVRRLFNLHGTGVRLTSKPRA